LRRRGLPPDLPAAVAQTVPAVNKVELYPTFQCNDRCGHCITHGGPERREMLDPDRAAKVLEHVRDTSLLGHLPRLLGQGRFECPVPPAQRELAEMAEPPDRLTYARKGAYAEALQGKGQLAAWVRDGTRTPLNFGRPSLRISGGEFFVWPREVRGRTLSEDERLGRQEELVAQARALLPDYDVWILTNGRFATSQRRAAAVVGRWARGANAPGAGGRTRIGISVDVFHRPPQGATVEQMLGRIWRPALETGLGAPFLYGLPNNRIGYLGRAFGRFPLGRLGPGHVPNASGSTFNPVGEMVVDPVDLFASGGCREVRGFVFEHGGRLTLVHNIVVAPSGHLVYCCACLGDYGDFVRAPRQALQRMLTDPVSRMLRDPQTVVPLMDTAVELDPTITVLGAGAHPAATASTCYQLMTGRRLNGGGRRPRGRGRQAV
jgi:hypothetical protein